MAARTIYIRGSLLLVLLAVAMPVDIAQAQRGVPEGAQVHSDLAYVPEGHERQKLDLYLPPKSEQPLPTIIWIHGGGWRNGDKRGGPALPLVADGYAVACINYRLSQHAKFPAQIEDCKAAIRWLRAHAKEYNLDPDRFGVWGASAGGHLVALVGTSGDVKELAGQTDDEQVSSRVQCVVDFFGPTDLTKMGGMHDRPDSPEALLLGGPVQEKKDAAATANPITYVTQDDPPFLIIHGDKDPLVPLSQSEMLKAALEKAEVEVTLMVLEGAAHGGPAFNAAETRDEISKFFAKHLKK